MQHVDEGALHAWLDEQIADPAEAARIEEHLRECRACRDRLAEETATFDRAQALLAGTAPAGERPSFEALVAKAGRDTPDDGTGAVAHVTRGLRQRQLVQLAWAASIVLAVGLGWTAREITGRDTLRQEPVSAIAEQSAVTPATQAQRAVAPPPAAEPATGAVVPNVPSADARARRIASGPQSQDTAASVSKLQESSRAADAVPSPLRPETQTAAAASMLERALSAPVETPPLAAPPAVAAAPPPAPAATTMSLAAPPPSTALRQEAITVSGATAGVSVVPVDASWRPLPRTEAAARTGMPLYGIEGREPTLTELSADGALVRTLYRLPSGAIVELIQQRAAPDSPAQDVQATTRGFAAPGRGGGAVLGGRTLPVRRAWADVRGGVRLTLQTTSDAADLAALGAQLRVD